MHRRTLAIAALPIYRKLNRKQTTSTVTQNESCVSTLFVMVTRSVNRLEDQPVHKELDKAFGIKAHVSSKARRSIFWLVTKSQQGQLRTHAI